MTIDEEALEWAVAAARGGKHVIVLMVDPDDDEILAVASRGPTREQALLLFLSIVRELEDRPQNIQYVASPRAS